MQGEQQNNNNNVPFPVLHYHLPHLVVTFDKNSKSVRFESSDKSSWNLIIPHFLCAEDVYFVSVFELPQLREDLNSVANESKSAANESSNKSSNVHVFGLKWIMPSGCYSIIPCCQFIPKDLIATDFHFDFLDLHSQTAPIHDGIVVFAKATCEQKIIQHNIVQNKQSTASDLIQVAKSCRNSGKFDLAQRILSTLNTDLLSTEHRLMSKINWWHLSAQETVLNATTRQIKTTQPQQQEPQCVTQSRASEIIENYSVQDACEFVCTQSTYGSVQRKDALYCLGFFLAQLTKSCESIIRLNLPDLGKIVEGSNVICYASNATIMKTIDLSNNNPSYTMLIRYTSHLVPNTSSFKQYSFVRRITLNEKLQIQKQQQWIEDVLRDVRSDTVPRQSLAYDGIEDARLIESSTNHCKFLCTTFEKDGRDQLMLCDAVPAKICESPDTDYSYSSESWIIAHAVSLPRRVRSAGEKNWLVLPIATDDRPEEAVGSANHRLWAIYHWYPFQVIEIECVTGNHRLIYAKEFSQFDDYGNVINPARFWHGSCPPIAIPGRPNHFLAMVHENGSESKGNQDCYIHRLVELEYNKTEHSTTKTPENNGSTKQNNVQTTISFDLCRWSRAFCFEEYGVEFVCGMCFSHDESQLLISYTVRDRSPAIAVLNKSKIDSLLVHSMNEKMLKAPF